MLDERLAMQVDFGEAQEMDVVFDAGQNFNCTFSDKPHYTTYAGPYRVTPAQEEQTLQTMGKLVSQNITVNPIPSNYGLITWDGSILTVS